MKMRLLRKCINVVAFSMVCTSLLAYQQKTYLRTRVAGSEDLVLKTSTWQLRNVDQTEDERKRFSMSATGFFSQSTNASSLGKYFGAGNGTNTITVGTRSTDLAPTTVAGDADVNGYRLVRQDFESTVRQPRIFVPPFAPPPPATAVNPAYDKTASPLTGKITLRPQQIAYGLRLDYQYDVSKRFFVTATLPIVHVENKLRPTFDNQNHIDLSNNQRWTLEDFFTGRLDNSQEKNAVPYEALDMRKASVDKNTAIVALRSFPAGVALVAPNGANVGPFDVFTQAGTFDAVTALWANTDQNYRSASSALNPPVVRADGTSPSGVAGLAFTGFDSGAGFDPIRIVESNLDDLFRTLAAQMDQTVGFGPVVPPATTNIPASDAIQIVGLASTGQALTEHQYLEATFPTTNGGVGLPDVLAKVAWDDEINRINDKLAVMAADANLDVLVVQPGQDANGVALRDLLTMASDGGAVDIIQRREQEVDKVYAANDIVNTFLVNRDRIESLTKAKLVEKKSKTGVADIDIAIGCHLTQTMHRHVDLTLGLTIPTAEKPKGTYLFEPIVGNGGHVALTLGLDAHRAFKMWSDKQFLLKTSWQYKYLFGSDQQRTLGVIVNDTRIPFGQYFVMGIVNQTGSLFPAANLLTTTMHVRPGSQLEGLVGVAFLGKKFSWDVGYNLHWKEREHLRVTDASNQMLTTVRLPNLDPAVATDGNPLLFNTTKSLTDHVPNVSQLFSIDRNVPRAPGMLNHCFYTWIGYQRYRGHSSCIIDFKLGGSYECANANATLDRYQVWGGCNVRF